MIQRGRDKMMQSEISNLILQLQEDECSDGEEEWFCFVCVEPYFNSLPGENWYQCYECKVWVHDACTGILRNLM